MDAVETMDESDFDSMVSDAEILSDADESSVESDSSAPTPARYRIPMRRHTVHQACYHAAQICRLLTSNHNNHNVRTRRKPTWMNSTDWLFKK